MRYHCEIYYGDRRRGSKNRGKFKLTIDAESAEEARAEATRAFKAAFPDETSYESSVTSAPVPRESRRDYSVRIRYRPGPETQTRQYDWSNCESEQSARDAAQKQFLAEHPGAQILKIESRLTR